MSIKKKLLVALAVVVVLSTVIAASVLGTVAYMTSASKVSNVFTVGNVFITLNETAVTPEGVPVPGAERTDKNSYHLMPGKSYLKDPAITVAADTESCYLFLVTRNQITEIQDPSKPTMADQMYANGWAIYKDTSAGSRVWVYCGSAANINGKFGDTEYTYTPVAVCGANRASAAAGIENVIVTNPDVMIKIFQEFHITTDKSTNLNIYSGAEVTINAVGIQSDSFGTIGDITSIDKAWAAVIAQYPYIQD